MRSKEEVALLLDNAPHHKPLESAEKADIGSGIDTYELGSVADIHSAECDKSAIPSKRCVACNDQIKK